MRRFAQFACLDWSGEAVARPKGIALACSFDAAAAPVLFRPDGGWSRAAVLEWLLALADCEADILIGIDFSPSLPFCDRGHYLANDDGLPTARDLWRFVDDACEAEPHLAASRFASHPQAAPHYRHQSGREIVRGDLFEGSQGRLRVVERACRDQRLGPAASCFNLIGAAQIGKSSLTGMRLLHRLTGRVPIWPFDPVPAAGR